jgi:hypothetical protein
MLVLPHVRRIAQYFECVESKEIWACTTTKMQFHFDEWLFTSQQSMIQSDD